MLQKFPYSTSSHSSVPGNHSPLPSQFCRVQMPQHWAHMVCSLPDGLLSLNNRHLSFISVSMAWQLISFYCLIIFHCMNKCSPLSTHSATKDILGLPSSVLPNKGSVAVSAQLLWVNTKAHSCCFLLHPVMDAPAAPGIASTWCCPLGPLGHVCSGDPCRRTGLRVLS